MSNQLLNYHAMLGFPCGEDADFEEIADYFGYILIEELKERKRKQKKKNPKMLDDGFENSCSVICPRCYRDSVQIVGVGDFRCSFCD